MNKEKFMNKKIIIAIVGAVLVVSAGAIIFAAKKLTPTDGKAAAADARGQNRESFENILLANTVPATLEEISSGEGVTVMGTTNQDGSVTAQTIVLGDLAFNPGQREGFGAQSGARTSSSGDQSNRQIPGDFQNLTQEERQARFQEMRANGGSGGRTADSASARQAGGSGGGFQSGSTAFVRGKVLSKDEVTLTIELPDGGSRLVVYSTKTSVVKATSTPALQ